jgi:hypothetical protein
MSDEKKPRRKFNETGLGQFLKEKVKPILGDVVDLAGDITGIEILNKVGDKLNAKRDEDAAIAALASEFEMKRFEWQMELDKMDNEYRMELLRTEMEVFKTEVQDRESARSREISFMQANGGKRDWLMGSVVIAGLLMVIGVILVLVFVEIPAGNQRLADMSFGTIMAFGASVFSYYLGTTKGSRSKDETIKRIS